MTQVNNKRTQNLVGQLTEAAISTVQTRLSTLKSKVRFDIDQNRTYWYSPELNKLIKKTTEYYALQQQKESMIEGWIIMTKSRRERLNIINEQLRLMRNDIRQVINHLCEPSPYNTDRWAYCDDEQELKNAQDELRAAYTYVVIMHGTRLSSDNRATFKAEVMRNFFETLTLPTVDNMVNEIIATYLTGLAKLEESYEAVPAAIPYWD